MKSLSTLLFAFLAFSTYSWAQPTHYGCHHSQHNSLQRPLTDAEQAMLKASAERSDTIDILDYEISLEIIDYTNRWIKGDCAIKFTPKMNGISMLPLDLLNLQIDSITANGAILTYNYNNLYLAVNLPSAMNIGDTATVQVYYQGTPTADPSWGGFKFDGNYAYNQGIGLNSNPYNMGRSWFPCFDNFIERATVGLNIITKLPRRAFGIGTFLGETVVANDTILRRYRMNQPVTTYITNVSVSDYIQTDYNHSGTFGTVPVQLVARSPDMGNMNNTFTQLGDAIDVLESWWGPYAWERVGYVLTPQGAMEHPTNITYPRTTGTGGNTAGHKGLMTHELGHCWWGDVVTLKGPYDMWIKEGNAEYSGHLLTEYLDGRSAFIDEVKSNLSYILRTAHVIDQGFQPLSGIPFEHTYGRHTYYKGAAMLHNMRAYMGDSLFRGGQQSVLNTYAYSAINAAEYRDELTAATGINMNAFFNDWIYAPGYASYEVNTINTTANGSTFDISVEIEQKLRGAQNLHTNTPIEVTFIDANWNKATISAMVSGKTTTIQGNIPFQPVYWFVNKENLLNLGQLHHEMHIGSQLSTTTIPYVDAVLYMTSFSDSVHLAMDHYWTAPDSIVNNPFNARISANHYWRIGGNVADLAGTIRFEYNAFSSPQLDADLVSITEDSLIMAYRPTPDSDWMEYPYYTKINLFNSTDGNGFMRLDQIMPGEYAFANGDLPDFVSATHSEEASVQSIKLFPNPAADYFNIEAVLSNENLLTIELFDLQGRLMYEEKNILASGTFLHQIPTTTLATGVYMLRLSDNKGLLIDSETVGVVR